MKANIILKRLSIHEDQLTSFWMFQDNPCIFTSNISEDSFKELTDEHYKQIPINQWDDLLKTADHLVEKGFIIEMPYGLKFNRTNCLRLRLKEAGKIMAKEFGDLWQWHVHNELFKVVIP
jgi:hypothetical protein